MNLNPVAAWPLGGFAAPPPGIRSCEPQVSAPRAAMCLGVAMLVIKHVVAPDGAAAVSGRERTLGMTSQEPLTRPPRNQVVSGVRSVIWTREERWDLKGEEGRRPGLGNSVKRDGKPPSGG